jgi:hypothetical protein
MEFNRSVNLAKSRRCGRLKPTSDQQRYDLGNPVTPMSFQPKRLHSVKALRVFNSGHPFRVISAIALAGLISKHLALTEVSKAAKWACNWQFYFLNRIATHSQNHLQPALYAKP